MQTRVVKRVIEQAAAGLRVNQAVIIPRAELEVRASRSSGPGGQHVNTSSTRAEISWKLRTSTALDSAQRLQVEKALASRLSTHGVLRVVASDTRSQRQNHELAAARLAALVRRALVVKKPRKRTRPHAGAVEQRLAEKKKRASRKRDRRDPVDD